MVLFAWIFAPSPLAATCTCTVQATAAPPELFFTGTSTGACERRTAIAFHLDGGLHLDTALCERATTCTRTGGPASTTCLRTGNHTVDATCECGKNAVDEAGNPFCDRDSGQASATFFVDTTPTVSVSVSGPDDDGNVTLSAPYTFPNTTRTRERALDLYVDGNFLFGNFDAQLAGTWVVPLRTDCWRQGPHEIKIVAGACNRGSDPAYRAEATAQVIVDHKPRISLSVGAAPPGSPPDRHLAKVTFDFPQTQKAEQRGLRLQAFPSGALLGEFPPPKQGVWEVEVSCNEGANRLLVATGFACGDTQTEAVAALPACAKPPRIDPCTEDDCGGCVGGPGGSSGPPVGGGPPPVDPADSGPGARLSYLGGGVGNPSNPGRAEWTVILGRNWSHHYAEKIVPDATVAGRVWLVTRAAGFVRFTDAGGDGTYESVAPEDEKRTLSRVSAGWELRDLDGTVQSFNDAGRWTATRDRNGNTKTAIYSGGHLASVAMPDGRREDFGYDPAGKLASITEIGVGGAAQRTWGYRWSGDDLTAIERPHGTELRFVYGDTRHPGLMTRQILVGADDGDAGTPRPERIEGAWEYDGEGNVLRTWRGAADFTSGVDQVELAYDNPFEPEETTVTYHRSPTERDLVVYRLARTVRWSGAKQRIVSISGDCSSCGLAPNPQLFYDDPSNPLRPTRTVDGRGHEALMSYDPHGRLVEKVEAVGAPESRTTRWSYDPTFPALVNRIELPSTSGGAALRSTIFGYDAAGNATSRRVQGVEAGSFFDLETVTDFNTAGQPLSIDPPGYGGEDETSFTYDPARGDLLPLTRTDPLVGTTTFEHDPFNRRTAIVDPNDLRTETVYDAADRVVAVIQRGATPTEDLVTRHAYNALGDLTRTTLPRGNVIGYGYDAAGRLVSVERKPDVETPGERTLYTLDGSGNRVREELQRWGGEEWVTESFTAYRYVNRCQVEKVLHADGTAVEHAYDCDGNLEKVWDENHPRGGQLFEGGGEEDCDEPPCEPPPGGGGPNEATQVYEYDALDRLTRVRQPWRGEEGGEAITRYGYDIQDHLVSVTDAEGNETTYTYSDRDLMTLQESPVSGTTTHAYNEHGELIQESDARGVKLNRRVDAAGRLTFLDAPDPALDTTYTYDDPAVFAQGRLRSISRGGQTLLYAYDRFGRVLQDGELTYAYDANGNRTAIGYPGGVVARYGHDFADREEGLEVKVGSAAPQPIVSSSSYKAFGPLASLPLGNGLAEIRSFTPRYQPEVIEVPGRLEQSYETDAAGNIRSVARAVGADRFFATYSYQAPQYFLTEGNGPWGQRAWTYDRIGNRLSEGPPGEGKDSPEVFLSTYEPNPAGGNTPKLARIEPVPGGEPGSRLDCGYDSAGNQTQVVTVGAECSGRTSSLVYDAERRLSRLLTSDGPGTTDLIYDGRGFLARSHLTFTESTDFVRTEPVYSSEGLLLARRFHQQTTRDDDGDGGSPDFEPAAQHTTYLFYFAGRLVAQLRRDEATIGGLGELLFLTTDHLGVPILATDKAGEAIWSGGLDPWGAPFVFPRPKPPGDDEPPPPPGGDGDRRPSLCEPEAPEGTASVETLGLFLRFPGQWDDPSFYAHGLHGGLYYNVHRWYGTGTGRYLQPDPIRLGNSALAYRSPLSDGVFVERSPLPSYYHYGGVDPLRHIDPLGLQSMIIPPVVVINCANDLHRRRLEGHQRFPGQANDFMRHCTTSCEAAEGPCGPLLARAGGFVNELQGLWLDIWNRQTGAFEFEDFAFNEQGFSCQQNQDFCSCEDCCRNTAPR